MPTSELSFASTQTFRNALMARNLAPYNIPGVYSPQVGQITYEPTISSYNVIDSPNNLIAEDPFVQQLYPLNQYGPEGGYNININYNNSANVVNSNQGIYDINDTKLDLLNEFNIDAAYLENVYGPQGGFNSMVEITNVQISNQIHQPYWSPPSFEPSTYSPYSILLTDNPVGTNGPLSNDSFIAKLGAERLRFAFRERVGAEIFQATVGAVDIQSLQDPFEATLLATGQQPLITKNYTITVPENPISRAALFALKISSAYLPVSPIPGDYFNENTKGGVQTNQTSTALNIVNSLTGGFLGPILNTTRNPSQIFLANTGNGQRSALFANLDFNRYQPGYDRTFGGLLGIGQAIAQTALNLLGLGSTKGGYYVGSKNAEPSTITSPPNQIPVDPFGRQSPAPVYGPSELAILYEGNQGRINFGLPAKPSIDAGGIIGSFVWVSPKSKGGAGYKATVGGGKGQRDSEFAKIENDYSKGQSTNITFKKSSILDQTQRLIDSADNVGGISKLKHVGNAINQVSKVFNDGYKEMTKGSQVVRYSENTTGVEVGVEYCRVFAKDTPYYTMADLQKSAGITKEGRKFSFSVLDNTYNLNIAPTKGEDSTNIVLNNSGVKYAKKYMFSIENLAWRTSSRPGFTYDELPSCEKGPNGGRVMWFPPYDLTFNDSSTASWGETDFLGRPEPIYTYKKTTRTGSLSWKIIVDSPSVLNVIVDKQLKGQTNKKIDSILESFFAGCVKFDLYKLAQTFNQFRLSELQEIQTVLTNPQLTPQELKAALDKIPKEVTTGNANGITNPAPKEIQEDGNTTQLKDEFKEYAFYFDNDVPGTDDKRPFNNLLDNYFSKKGEYEGYSSTFTKLRKEQTNTSIFFDSIIRDNYLKFSLDFVNKAEEVLKTGKDIIMILEGSASALNDEAYNKALSQRRIDSIKEWFKTTTLGKYIRDTSPRITFKEEAQGEVTVVPKGSQGAINSIDCNQLVSPNKKDKENIYTTDAMACRRVVLKTLLVNEPPPETTSKTITDPEGNLISQPTPTIDVTQRLRAGIGKKILRRLLSECDYFEMIQNDAPFVYDSIREKLKYFNPAFHSMTPEGLNARLTFLNQCVRPGETIPVIGPDGKPKFNDALNTSFGTPPILVLRIGDFYNTKIVPDNLAITYEPLIFDMNPEGIGIQPMIAKVTLSFKFIGGHGLARPVEQLQNALSFNYYANTEIYDERAVATEDTSKLDRQIFEKLVEGQVNAGIANAIPQQDNRGGATIGDIATTVPVSDQTGTGETGNITYKKVADQTLSTSKQYFTNFYNTALKIIEQNNYGIWQLVSSERNYTKGNFAIAKKIASEQPGSQEVLIYGKPKDLETRLVNLGKKVLDDINNDTNYVIKNMKDYKEFTTSDIETLKSNMNEYVSKFLSTFNTPIFQTMQTFTIFQQDMVQNFRKLNVVNNRADGKIVSNGKPFVYSADGTNDVTQQTPPNTEISDTLIELAEDYTKLAINYQKFSDFVKKSDINLLPGKYDESIGFDSYSKDLKDVSDKQFFMVMARVFSDKNKLNDFKNALLKQDLNKVRKFERKLEKVLDDFKSIVDDELKIETKRFKDIKKNKEFINFEKKDSYSPNKKRKFNYTTIIDSAEKTKRDDLVSKLWSNVNVDSNAESWEGKIKFD